MASARSSEQDILGIHHITVLASDPQRNLDFYVKVLGLRLVKKTVNFDAPDVYHLYYGDEIGRPGTILTFFPFPDAARGKPGAGEVAAVAFSVPKRALEFWVERLSRHGIHFEGPSRRLEEEFIAFRDPDGLQIEFFFVDGDGRTTAWVESPVPPEFAAWRFHGVTLQLQKIDQTAALLTETMGFQLSGQRDDRVRYYIGKNSDRAAIDILVNAHLPFARTSAGSVHHIAWRTPDDLSQLTWQQKIAEAGLSVTEIIDRQYFRSIYYRGPGGILFEIATDPPGFTRDERTESLGMGLMLPPWLEPSRGRIERILPPISLPSPMVSLK
jgi:glyoxalase family protein